MNHILGEPAITTSDLNKMLGFTITEKYLTKIGCPPREHTKTANLWYCDDFPSICAGIARDMLLLKDKKTAPCHPHS